MQGRKFGWGRIKIAVMLKMGWWPLSSGYQWRHAHGCQIERSQESIGKFELGADWRMGIILRQGPLREVMEWHSEQAGHEPCPEDYDRAIEGFRDEFPLHARKMTANGARRDWMSREDWENTLRTRPRLTWEETDTVRRRLFARRERPNKIAGGEV